MGQGNLIVRTDEPIEEKPIESSSLLESRDESDDDADHIELPKLKREVGIKPFEMKNHNHYVHCKKTGCIMLEDLDHEHPVVVAGFYISTDHPCVRIEERKDTVQDRRIPTVYAEYEDPYFHVSHIEWKEIGVENMKKCLDAGAQPIWHGLYTMINDSKTDSVPIISALLSFVKDEKAIKLGLLDGVHNHFVLYQPMFINTPIKKVIL